MIYQIWSCEKTKETGKRKISFKSSRIKNYGGVCNNCLFGTGIDLHTCKEERLYVGEFLKYLFLEQEEAL